MLKSIGSGKQQNFYIINEKKPKQYSKKIRGYEIIVSDDSDNEDSRLLIRKKFNYIKYVKGKRNGPGNNRNNGSKIAKGKWLIFIDDDCYVNNDFLQSYCSTANKSDHYVIEGKIVCPNKVNSPFYRQPENIIGNCLPSGNFAIKNKIFKEIGGFDEDLKIMEDMELAFRLKSSGYKIHFCTNAIAFHPSQKKKMTFYWEWIFHFRWQLLLNYKCGLKSRDSHIILSFLEVTYSHINYITRLTFHLFTKHDKDRYLMYWFERILAWTTMPIVLLYLCYWDLIYHSKFKNKKIF